MKWIWNNGLLISGINCRVTNLFVDFWDSLLTKKTYACSVRSNSCTWRTSSIPPIRSLFLHLCHMNTTGNCALSRRDPLASVWRNPIVIPTSKHYSFLCLPMRLHGYRSLPDISLHPPGWPSTVCPTLLPSAESQGYTSYRSSTKKRVEYGALQEWQK